MHGITVAIAIMRLGAVLSTMKIKLGKARSETALSTRNEAPLFVRRNHLQPVKRN
ncbi:hypothetical protein PghCCS26_18150 [Paenibacillus glycanilyticus]|uniref:Uncharacterized protein n=1 Tax=Paenibacillus glycanilyticus TaxID=126569 RepID=A0ABQ6NKJ1_9BACL|nr:hypothetical protein PghCCS26_18150 [Paenibacillus glycanilyticus]